MQVRSVPPPDLAALYIVLLSLADAWQLQSLQTQGICCLSKDYFIGSTEAEAGQAAALSCKGLGR